MNINFGDIISKVYSGGLSCFAKASIFTLPFAGSINEVGNVDEIREAMERFNWLVEDSGFVFKVEERAAAAITIKNNTIDVEKKVELLTEAVRDKENFLEEMRHHSARMYTLVFTVETEGNEQIEKLVRVLAAICVENLPHFGFYELEETNEMVLTTNKEDVEITE